MLVTARLGHYSGAIKPLAARWYQEDPDLAQWMGFERPPDEETIGRYLDAIRGNQSHTLLPIQTKSGEIVGYTHLAWEYQGLVNVGLVVPDQKGYAYSGMVLSLDHAFLRMGAHKIMAEVREHHATVFEGLMRIEGVLREHRFIGGKWINAVALGLLREEYDTNPLLSETRR
mgnify:CR=1 FL=1